MVIFGWRTSVQHLAMLMLTCQYCRHAAAHNLHRRVTKFTVFFIPLIPLSRKHALQCTYCGAAYDISRPQADQLLAGRVAA